jgi:hypothetical protein
LPLNPEIVATVLQPAMVATRRMAVRHYVKVYAAIATASHQQSE